MSFGRLLAAGKSLVGLRNGGTPYRADKNVRLPKFGSAKNPFASSEATVTQAAAEASPAKAVIATARAERSAPEMKAPRKAIGVGAITWLGSLGKKLNPVPRLRRGPARSAAPAPVQVPTQGELSLDRVTVMRNDLSDTDYEVVRPVVAKSVSPVVAMTAEKLEPVGAAWNRLTTRFFGDDQN